MIDAWWRSPAHQWLYLHSVDSVATIRRLVTFYEWNETRQRRLISASPREQQARYVENAAMGAFPRELRSFPGFDRVSRLQRRGGERDGREDPTADYPLRRARGSPCPRCGAGGSVLDRLWRNRRRAAVVHVSASARGRPIPFRHDRQGREGVGNIPSPGPGSGSPRSFTRSGPRALADSKRPRPNKSNWRSQRKHANATIHVRETLRLKWR
jgi:hypothetical protein